MERDLGRFIRHIVNMLPVQTKAKWLDLRGVLHKCEIGVAAGGFRNEAQGVTAVRAWIVENIEAEPELAPFLKKLDEMWVAAV